MRSGYAQAVPGCSVRPEFEGQDRGEADERDLQAEPLQTRGPYALGSVGPAPTVTIPSRRA